jgi:hypothetical protein
MWRCETCGKAVRHPIEGVNIHTERGDMWCVHCAPIIMRMGKPVLDESAENARGRLVGKKEMSDD